jgi:flavin-binding protein dodecin
MVNVRLRPTSPTASLSCGVLSETIGCGSRYIRGVPDGGRRERQRVEEGAVSVYRVTDLIGTSTESWQDAAATAISTARSTVRDLRVAEVVEQDVHIGDDGALTYRTKLRVSFKYESER